MVGGRYFESLISTNTGATAGASPAIGVRGAVGTNNMTANRLVSRLDRSYPNPPSASMDGISLLHPIRTRERTVRSVGPLDRSRRHGGVSPDAQPEDFHPSRR